ncbi:hypothetical protein C1646_765464 [Rhizophagus diaphanus]|nr:hypothetical protein C1646_765464 [Rhizophagus diaphanus] [Rhizophagus sp. MUCL 43196]
MKLNYISFFITISIILLTLSPVKSSIIFEENQNSTDQLPRVFGLDCYDDNTIVVRIVRKDPTKFQCLEDYLSIRTIYPNGTVKGFDLSSDTLNIQSFNFSDDINNPYTYNDWGVVIDLDGGIHSKIKLGPSYVNITTKDWKPGQDSIKPNVHRDNGFLRAAPITNSTGYSLQQFKIDENGGIQQIVETVNIYPTSYPLETVATMDGGYALIYPNNTGSTTISTTPLTPQFGIYCLLLGYGKGITQGPIVLYQTLTPISVLLLDCEFSYVGVGQTCMIIANSTLTDKIFIKIDFLSSGTVYNITTFQNSAITTDYNIKSLRYGGYFSFYAVRSIDKKNFDIYGYIMDYYGTLFNWDLTYPTLTNPIADILVLPNNTLVIPQPEEGKSWSLLTTDLYKIEGERDHGYDNLHIDTTIPKIGDVINSSETKFLIIKYYNKVSLSPNRNVTILQDDGTSHGIIRQMTSMTSTGDDGYDKFVNLIDDEFGSIINITIIDSTFNKPGGRYYVLIDDGFASSKDYHEPMIGIQSSVWNFTTLQDDDHPTNIKGQYQKIVNSVSINGKIRLTLDGTVYFKSIRHDKNKRKEFFDNLTQELAKAIPVSTERITSSGRHEIDTSVSPEQYILSINIEKVKNKDDNSVNLVASDLNTLIKNKFITLIGSGEYSNYLDHEYGYVTIPRWFEENWKSLVGTGVLNIGLSSYSYKKGKFAIYACGNAIEEFVTTILFTSIDAGSVENIFTTSIFFVTLPFIVNLGFAFAIIIIELTRSESDLKKLTKVNKLLNEIVRNSDHTESTYNKLIKEIKKSIEEDDDIKLTKELEEVKYTITEIEVSSKDEKNNTEVDVKNIIKKLKVINELIKEIMQFEDFVQELKELDILTSSLNEFTKDPEKYKAFKEVKDELEKVKKNFQEFNEFTKKLNEEFEKNQFTEKLNKAKSNDLMKGLEEVIELAEELEKVKMFIDKLYGVEDSVKDVGDTNEMKNNEENGYHKFSKWLKDHRDNQMMTVIFIILAGVDITHLELLGSKMQIQIHSNKLNFLGLKRFRSFNIYFNAKLSRAAQHKIIWGKFFNALIGDISLIFLQCFYVTQVVSLGYIPVYNILKASIDLFGKGFAIIKYVRENRNEKVTTNT